MGFTGDDSGNTEVDLGFSYRHGFVETVVLVICMRKIIMMRILV